MSELTRERIIQAINIAEAECDQVPTETWWQIRDAAIRSACRHEDGVSLDGEWREGSFQELADWFETLAKSAETKEGR